MERRVNYGMEMGWTGGDVALQLSKKREASDFDLQTSDKGWWSYRMGNVRRVYVPLCLGQVPATTRALGPFLGDKATT